MAFPNFFLIGPPKTATTSLFQYLGQHPDIFLSPVKEPGYFLVKDGEYPEVLRPDLYACDSLGVYQDLFSGAESSKAVGEASTLYFYSQRAARNLYTDIPTARLITVLRNPVDRAFSEFLMWKQAGRMQDRTFEEVLDVDLLQPWKGNSLPPVRAFVQRGKYFQYLNMYLELFPRAQLKVLFFEDLKVDPQAVVAEIFDFLEISPINVDTSLALNRSGIPRSGWLSRLLLKPNWLKDMVRQAVPRPMRRQIRIAAKKRLLAKPELSHEARHRMITALREDIHALERLTGRDLSGWLSV
jgi:hypothetical protein